MPDSELHPPSFCTNRDCLRCGNYIAGLVDEEGCFCLLMDKRKYGRRRPMFRIKLRCDDLRILQDIRSFFSYGTLSINRKEKFSKLPQANYSVQSLDELVNILIPFFERFPLRAKKAKDFAIWKEAVRFIYRIPFIPSRGRGLGGGGRRWDLSDIQEIDEMCSSLQNAREFPQNMMKASVHNSQRGNRKLNDVEEKAVIRLRQAGLSIHKLASWFRLSDATIFRIVRKG